MKRARLLRVMLAAFVAWLNEQMQPAGKASLHTLEARATVLIDALPQDGTAPDLAVLETLDACSVEAGLGWLLTSMRTAYPDEWASIAVESLRLLLHKNLCEVVSATGPPPPETVKERGEGGSHES